MTHSLEAQRNLLTHLINPERLVVMNNYCCGAKTAVVQVHWLAVLDRLTNEERYHDGDGLHYLYVMLRCRYATPNSLNNTWKSYYYSDNSLFSSIYSDAAQMLEPVRPVLASLREVARMNDNTTSVYDPTLLPHRIDLLKKRKQELDRLSNKLTAEQQREVRMLNGELAREIVRNKGIARALKAKGLTPTNRYLNIRWGADYTVDVSDDAEFESLLERYYTASQGFRG